MLITTLSLVIQGLLRHRLVSYPPALLRCSRTVAVNLLEKFRDQGHDLGCPRLLSSPLSSGCGGDEWKDLEFSQAWFKLIPKRSRKGRDF